MLLLLPGLQCRECRVAGEKPQAGRNHTAGLLRVAALAKTQGDLGQCDGRTLKRADAQALVEIRDRSILSLGKIQLNEGLAGESIGGISSQRLAEIVRRRRIVLLRDRLKRPHIGRNAGPSQPLSVREKVERKFALVR